MRARHALSYGTSSNYNKPTSFARYETAIRGSLYKAVQTLEARRNPSPPLTPTPADEKPPERLAGSRLYEGNSTSSTEHHVSRTGHLRLPAFPETV